MFSTATSILARSATTRLSGAAFTPAKSTILGSGLRSAGVSNSSIGARASTTLSSGIRSGSRAGVLPKRIVQQPKNNAGGVFETNLASLRRVMSSGTQAPVLGEYTKAQKIVGGSVLTILTLQALFGSTTDYFSYRFICTCDPDDLAGFYGGEEFMELYCIFPFVGALMMRGGYFDDEGTVHTQGFPGELLVSMVFSDEADEETEQTKWFNKWERFHNVCFGYTMWDQVTNFGFHTLPDGRLEVYHHGEYFTGYLPGVSLLMKTLFQFQAYWVAYATEYHLNYIAFRSETDEEEEKEELSRKNFWWYMLKYEVFGSVKEKFGLGQTERTRTLKPEHVFDDEVDTTQVINVKRRSTVAQIEKDKLEDKYAGPIEEDEPDEIADPSKGMNVYRRATVAALKKHKTLRVLKRKTTAAKLAVEQ